ncbi:MAG: DUF3006 domain-containing protein [Bacteroidota bacterium]
MDRIEAGVAILIPKGRPGTRIEIQREFLPPAVRDGSLLRVSIELDPQGARAGDEIAALQRELAEGGAGPMEG